MDGAGSVYAHLADDAPIINRHSGLLSDNLHAIFISIEGKEVHDEKEGK